MTGRPLTVSLPWHSPVDVTFDRGARLWFGDAICVETDNIVGLVADLEAVLVRLRGRVRDAERTAVQ